MKKFFLTLLFLIILGGVVFYFGWAQRTVPPGSYGVMRSRTHGLESSVIKEGEFRWIWYKLIPTNAKVANYTLRTVKYPFRSTGNLSSGQVYAALAGLEADFSWEISGEISFSLNPDLLPNLTVRENISDDAGLREAENRLAEKIGNFAIQWIRTIADGDNEEKIESILISGDIPELNNEIEKVFPEIENLTCTIRIIRYPDFALYQTVKALYREFMARQGAVLRNDTVSEAEKRIRIRTRIDELTQYGELLTKYPILLQYLSLNLDDDL